MAHYTYKIYEKKTMIAEGSCTYDFSAQALEDEILGNYANATKVEVTEVKDNE